MMRKVCSYLYVYYKGRRPVNIAKAALRVLKKEKKFLLFTDSFSKLRPHVLDENNPSCDFMAPEDQMELDKAYYIVVHDAKGKKYKKYMHKFPRLWRIRYCIKHRIIV